MEDNKTVTHGLHWLTLGQDGWKCAHPDCDWHLDTSYYTNDAHHIFNRYHKKLSEPGVSVQP